MNERKPPWTPGPWMWWDSCSWRRLGTEDQSTKIMVPITQSSDRHPDLSFPNGGYLGPDACLLKAAPDLAEALIAAKEHLEYCGYGDQWEREKAKVQGLAEKIDKSLKKAGYPDE